MVEPASSSSVIFGPMLRAFTWLYDTWRSKSREALEERRRAYSQHFEPAYKRLETIHTNYLTSFHKFYDLCRKFETPPLDLLHQFQQFGMEYATWREDLRNFSMVTRELVKSFRRPDEKEAIEAFREAVVDYFNVSIPSREFHHWPSWFTDFIRDFETHVREGRSPWDAEYRGIEAKDPKGTFIMRLRAAYESELPAKWSAVAAAKAKVQAVFNK
ncbi:hypothetical protein SAMN05216386_1372 [Nitrosospira briensis]|uniref:Uncharacterized protein n=1 Tax=Nitrosospira briensis TaxID=35799 RepID=A0A1I5AGB3_9PROT|nr:hypothetical protein [Nitrosospira briensis]SFN61473.1 hypothetical protein SAMN05216386_1372 [Nitrosospira briensis]